MHTGSVNLYYAILKLVASCRYVGSDAKFQFNYITLAETITVSCFTDNWYDFIIWQLGNLNRNKIKSDTCYYSG